MYDRAVETMSSLRQFYNSDAMNPVCAVDELSYGGKFTYESLASNWEDGLSSALSPDEKTTVSEAVSALQPTGYYSVAEKFITDEPTVVYTI